MDALLLALSLLGIYALQQKSWIDARLIYENDRVLVDRAGARQSPFIPGDQIQSLSGHDIGSIEDVEFLCDQQRIGSEVEVGVLRRGQSSILNVVLVPYNRLAYMVVLVITAALFFSIGLFVLKRGPDSDVSRIFHWISLTVTMHILTTWGSLAVIHPYVGYGLRVLFLFASSFTPVLFIHFSLIFPRSRRAGYRRIMRPLYLVAAVLGLLLSLAFYQSLFPASLDHFHLFMKLYNYGRLLFAAAMIFGVANFILSYQQAIEESERRKLRWVILGLAIGPLGFVLLWQIPQTIISTGLLPEEAILLLSAVTPLMFAVSIVRYHILDIDHLFNRSTVYFLTVTSVFGIYALLVGLAAAFVGVFTTRISVIVSALAAVIVALLFEPVRRNLQHLVDRKFFRVRYNYRQAVREMTNRINHSFDLKELSRFLIHEIDRLFKPRSCAFVMQPDSDGQWKLMAHNNRPHISGQTIDSISRLCDQTLDELLALPRYLEEGIGYYSLETDFCRTHRIVLVAPVRLQNARSAGFLLLDRKTAPALYSHEDADLLCTVMRQMGLAIERIRLQQKLLLKDEETRRLDALNRLKSYFVSSVSHELQTPLTSIRLFSELLQNDQQISEKEKREYLEIITGESERLGRLINNVLDFSRIERGVKEYHFRRQNLSEVLRSALRSMKYQLSQGGFTVESELPDQQVMLSIDADAMAEALTNLIANAIKYSNAEKYLGVWLRRKDNRLEIGVRDRGIGIPKKDQEKIFDTFYRSGDKQVQALGGTGLGLTLVKEVVQAHGGEIKLISEPGKGTTFIISLPFGEEE